jgi:hypothetical protein
VCLFLMLFSFTGNPNTILCYTILCYAILCLRLRDPCCMLVVLHI